MEYFNNTLCIEAGWLYGAGDILSKSNYDALCNRGKLNVVRRAAFNTPALVDYKSIPARFKKLIIVKIGNPYTTARFEQFTKHITTDADAIEFFSNYKLPDERNLKPETQQEYVTNSTILNAIEIVINERKSRRRSMGGNAGDIWEHITHVSDQIRVDYKHTLPSNQRRLYDRFRKYRKGGYYSLIHKNFCNSHSRKVNESIEGLILGLYCQPNKPYITEVNKEYYQFLAGVLEVADIKTGEIYNPEEFINDTGKPIFISDSTIANYINMPKNRAIVDKIRNDSKFFNDRHRPHHHRTSPEYSLSKISMDDRDLPRKQHNGIRPKVYYSYDVASTAVIGVSYSSIKKDADLFINCMRDMFQFLEINGLGQPIEVEVEHHLVNLFADDLMKAGMIFPNVTWCAPGNSQQKRAEHFNKAKKYGYEKKYQNGIGRHDLKLEANRPRQVGEWNEDGMRIKEKYFTFEQLIADDRATIVDYNNDLHPNQKKYKGKSRLQVLRENQNPDVQNIQKSLLMRYIGNVTETTITRNQYMSVQHEKYTLPTPYALEILEPNNRKVKAYWLPNSEGEITEIQIYQNNQFICTCAKLVRYNESIAETTDADREAFTNQSKYVSQFDAMTRAGTANIPKIEKLQPVEATSEPEIIETVDYNSQLENNLNDDTVDFYEDDALLTL